MQFAQAIDSSGDSASDALTSTVNSLASQILGQNTTQYWSGEGFGSAKANATDMARILANAGLTDINQFGARNVSTTYDDGEGGSYNSTSTRIEYYNKATGVTINPNYDRAGGSIWSGTFAGSGSTSYGVQFDTEGNNPVFYTQYGGSTSDVGTIMPLIQIALMATGAGGLVGGLLTDAVGVTLSNAVTAGIGNAAIGGGLAAATGGNVLQSAVLSGAAGYYGTQLNTTLNSNPLTSGLGTTVNSAITGGVLGGTGALLTGGDIGQGVLTGAATGAAGQMGADYLQTNATTLGRGTDYARSWDYTDANGVYDGGIIDVPDTVNVNASSTSQVLDPTTVNVTDTNTALTDPTTVTVTDTNTTATDPNTVTVTAPRDTADQGTVTVTAPRDGTDTSTIIDPGEIPHHDPDTTNPDTPETPVVPPVTPPPVVVTPPDKPTTSPLASVTRATPKGYPHAPSYANNPAELEAAAQEALKRMNGGRTSTVLTGGKGEDESKLSTSKILLGR